MYFLDWIFVDVYFSVARKSALDFFSGEQKRGCVCMYAQWDFFVRLDGKFISSIFSQQDIYIYLISITQ